MNSSLLAWTVLRTIESTAKQIDGTSMASRWPSAKSASTKKALITPPFWCCIARNCNLHMWVLQHKMAISIACLQSLDSTAQPQPFSGHKVPGLQKRAPVMSERQPLCRRRSNNIGKRWLWWNQEEAPMPEPALQWMCNNCKKPEFQETQRKT